MIVRSPHFLLYSNATRPEIHDEMGSWRFVLQAADGSERLEATDEEANMSSSRLELLAVIRGLEALNQPSRVTLVTPSRYVGGGLRYGLDQWRSSGWRWDRFGVMSPIKNEDLWRRLDQALTYHVVECRVSSDQDVPLDLAGRFRVERPMRAAMGADEHLEWAQRGQDQPWPRDRWKWRRRAAALAAAACGLIWLRAG